jgi:hypothetical protein
MTYYTYAQAGLGVLGMVAGGIGGGLDGFTNGAKLLLGNFYLNEGNWLGGVGQGISRHTWEMLQTLIGNGFSQGRNVFGDVDRVDYFGGSTFATQENYTGKNGGGISIGNYININLRGVIDLPFDEYVTSNPLYMHEYGHTRDSRLFGISYLFAVGIPSLISAKNAKPIEGESVSTHAFKWYEMRANKQAAKYFKKYGVGWDMYETYHPRTKR